MATSTAAAAVAGVALSSAATAHAAPYGVGPIYNVYYNDCLWTITREVFHGDCNPGTPNIRTDWEYRPLSNGSFQIVNSTYCLSALAGGIFFGATAAVEPCRPDRIDQQWFTDRRKLTLFIRSPRHGVAFCLYARSTGEVVLVDGFDWDACLAPGENLRSMYWSHA